MKRTPDEYKNQVAVQWEQIRTGMANSEVNGVAGLPIWVTETGFGSNPSGRWNEKDRPGNQRDALIKLYQYLSGRTDVLILYRLVDLRPQNADGTFTDATKFDQRRYGTYFSKPDGKLYGEPKPAFCALRSLHLTGRIRGCAK